MGGIFFFIWKEGSEALRLQVGADCARTLITNLTAADLGLGTKLRLWGEIPQEAVWPLWVHQKEDTVLPGTWRRGGWGENSSRSQSSDSSLFLLETHVQLRCQWTGQLNTFPFTKKAGQVSTPTALVLGWLVSGGWGDLHPISVLCLWARGREDCVAHPTYLHPPHGSCWKLGGLRCPRDGPVGAEKASSYACPCLLVTDMCIVNKLCLWS